MGNWKTCTIGDLGTVVGGATPSTKKNENYDGGTISWITPKDLAGFSGRFISHGERNITEVGLKSCSTQLMPTHTVLFSSRAPIGYIAIADREVCTNQGFKSVVPNEDTDYIFLYYLLKYNKDRIESLGSGTTFKEVSGSTMRGIEVFVPDSIEEQRQIASVLSALDDKIEKNMEINDNLYEQVTTYYKHLFAGITSTTSVGEMADNIFSGGTPSTANEAYWNGDHYWLSSGETSNRFIVSTIKTITDEGITNSSTRKANKYDIAIASAGQGHTRGQTSMLLTETYVNQSIIVVHANGDYLPFLFWNIANRYEELRVISNSNSIRGSLTTKMISSLNIPKTEATRIKQFSDCAWPIIKTIENNLNENQRLTAIRDVLLPKLMSGELDVSNLDI